MNCVIPGSNVKFLGKALHTLAKIGDEIYFEAHENQIVLSAVNATTTEFGWFKLLRQFFTEYYIADDLSKTDTPDETVIGVKIRAKPLCVAFKCINILDKNLETCTISLGSNPTKIKLNFKYKNKICRFVHIWLMDGDESLVVSSLDCPDCHKIASSSATFSHALANFRRTDNEITFIANPAKLVMRNYMDGDEVKLNAVRSQVSLSSNEFDTYEIVENATVTFPLRAFRAAVHFAESFNRQITVIFKEGGRPVEVQFSNNTTFRAKFIMATMHLPDYVSPAPSPDPDAPDISPLCSPMSIDLLEGLNEPANEPVEEQKPAELLPEMEDDEEEDEIIDLCDDDEDESEVIPASPENSHTKRMRFLFQRCLEPTFNRLLPSDEEIFAENSDPECEALLYDD